MFAKTHLAELAGNSIKVPMLSMITILITTVYSYINIMSCVIHINIMSFLMSSKKGGGEGGGGSTNSYDSNTGGILKVKNVKHLGFV